MQQTFLCTSLIGNVSQMTEDSSHMYDYDVNLFLLLVNNSQLALACDSNSYYHRYRKQEPVPSNFVNNRNELCTNITIWDSRVRRVYHISGSQ